MLYYDLLAVSYLVSTPLSETEQIIQLQKKLAWAELKIQVLEAQLRLQRIKKYVRGARSSAMRSGDFPFLAISRTTLDEKSLEIAASCSGFITLCMATRLLLYTTDSTTLPLSGQSKSSLS